MPLSPSAQLGSQNSEVFGEWMGMSEDELDELRREGVI
jgi:hypothetical protein